MVPLLRNLKASFGIRRACGFIFHTLETNIPRTQKVSVLTRRLHVDSESSILINRKGYASSRKLLGLNNSSTILRNAFNHKVQNTSERQIASTTMNGDALAEKYPARERKFDNPYGHIAALEWGKEDAPHKILCVHGWLDNAGSFERLVPLLLDHGNNADLYHVVAMDHPGVGHSSHIPAGAQYTSFTTILEMRRITQQLKWDKVILLSHSLGSHLSFIYSCIYTNQVESMISIDLTMPMSSRINNWNLTLAESIDEYFKYEYIHEEDPVTNIRVPVYSEADALARLMAGHSNSLTTKSAEVLLKRGAKKQRWGLTFRRDLRLRVSSLEFKPDEEMMLKMVEGPFKPNLLLIKALQSPYFRSESLKLRYYELYSKNCTIFREAQLDGTHHLHMNDPELVAPEVNNFLDEVRKSVSKETLTKSNL